MLPTVSTIFAGLALLFWLCHIIWPHVPLWVCVLMLVILGILHHVPGVR